MKIFTKKTTLLSFFSLSLCAFQTHAVGVISYAQTAAGSPYRYGGSTWHPKDKTFGGVDCSALVQKSWAYPRRFSPQEKLPYPRFTSYALANPKSNGYPFSISSNLTGARSGDAMAYSHGPRKRGHALLVKSVQNGVVQTVEARGRSAGVGNFTRTISSLRGQGYRVIKRNGGGSPSLKPKNDSQSIEIDWSSILNFKVAPQNSPSSSQKAREKAAAQRKAAQKKANAQIIAKIEDIFKAQTKKASPNRKPRPRSPVRR